MSQTATATASETPRKITVLNGTTYTFNSNISTTLEQIPIIDGAGIWSENLEDRKAVAEEIRTASREIGFFYLVNHVSSMIQRCVVLNGGLYDRMTKGVAESYAKEALNQAKRFFALPEEKKMEVFTGLVPNEYVGFHPMECYNRNGWKHQGRLPIIPT